MTETQSDVAQAAPPTMTPPEFESLMAQWCEEAFRRGFVSSWHLGELWLAIRADIQSRANGGWRTDFENMPKEGEGRFLARRVNDLEVFRHLDSKPTVIYARTGLMFEPAAWKPIAGAENIR